MRVLASLLTGWSCAAADIFLFERRLRSTAWRLEAGCAKEMPLVLRLHALSLCVGILLAGASLRDGDAGAGKCERQPGGACTCASQRSLHAMRHHFAGNGFTSEAQRKLNQHVVTLQRCRTHIGISDCPLFGIVPVFRSLRSEEACVPCRQTTCCQPGWGFKAWTFALLS